MAMSIPRAASFKATSLPMPVAPPVISATFLSISDPFACLCPLTAVSALALARGSALVPAPAAESFLLA